MNDCFSVLVIYYNNHFIVGTVVENFNIENLSKEHRDIIEADSFWCLSKFLDCIQDNYIFAQLGIQTKVNQLKDLIQRVDGNLVTLKYYNTGSIYNILFFSINLEPLHKHLQMHGVDYLQFSFRWMNNLLTRELPLHCTIRLWDTYLAESDGFASFQLYVCAAFLLQWREQILHEKDFQVCYLHVFVNCNNFITMYILITFAGFDDFTSEFANTRLDRL